LKKLLIVFFFFSFNFSELLSQDSTLHPTILPAFGYTMQTNWAAALNYHLGFYTGKIQDSNHKISSINTSITYTLDKQILFPFQSYIWSKNNKYNYFTDLRFMQYPSITYGLGPRSSLENGYYLNYNYLKIHQTVSKNISPHFYGGLGFYYDHYWNIEQLDQPSITKTSFDRYGYTPTEIAVGIAANILYDSRLNQITPTNGMYGKIVYRPNFTFLGSDNDWSSILIEARKYIHLSKNSKNILALWSYNWLTLSGKPPYLFLPSTGWDDLYNTGRGYIQGRYRGKNMLYFETEYRFGITPNGKIGGVVFANAQSFSKDIKSELNVVAPGYGLGLRFKINKHSNTNVCIDYAFGTDGSNGIFVNLGEVF